MNSRLLPSSVNFNSNNNDTELILNKNITKEFLSQFSECDHASTYLKPPSMKLPDLNILRNSDITLVVGPSGSGKTTWINNLIKLYPNQMVLISPELLEWDNNKGIVSYFDNVDQSFELLGSIGLNTIPTWLKPYNILSNGEKYRACFARLLKLGFQYGESNDKIIIIDEFTSVLDRQTAFNMCTSLSRQIRNHAKSNSCPFILCSANFDIIPYLQPKLVINIDNGKMKYYHNDNVPNKLDVKTVLNKKQMEQQWGLTCKELVPNVSEHNISNLNEVNEIKFNSNKVMELRCEIKEDDFTDEASKAFDYEFDGIIKTHLTTMNRNKLFDDDYQFNIGIIVGPSGSGKTSTAQHYFKEPDTIKWSDTEPIFAHFNDLMDCIEKLECVNLPICIGLNKYNNLSTGQKERINIARKLNKNNTGCIVIDEYTSFIDRNTALYVTKNIYQYVIRNKVTNVVLISCHRDIIDGDYIKPDWILDTQHQSIKYYKPKHNINKESMKINNIKQINPTQLPLNKYIKSCYANNLSNKTMHISFQIPQFRLYFQVKSQPIYSPYIIYQYIYYIALSL